MISSVALFSAFVAAAVAAPADQPLPTEVVNRLNAHLGIARGGALDLPVPTAPAKLAAGGPDEFTVSIIMAHTAAITSVHVESKDSPVPVGGRIAPGNAGNMTVQSFVVPRGYSGNIAFNNAGYRVDTGDESLIELSFENQLGLWTPDIDVSYVNGFSVPISCHCYNPDEGSGDGHTEGCAKDLWSLHQCPEDNGQHSCRNPRRFDEQNKTPTEFFAPCNYYGGAYTYPDDNLANTLNGGHCRDGTALCCVGNLCSGWDSQPR